jgi:hypothetical protein
VRLDWRVALVVATAGLLACNDIEVCGSRQDTVFPDDYTYRCATAEDCPRSARVSVCITDVSPQQECVRCDQTVCVRVIPVSCN